MGLRINTNVAALNIQRHLFNATQRVSRSMERLSSGMRINRAADDAAGLAISEGLKSEIHALDVASRNAADGISLVQTAEGALDTTSELLIRMRELAMQSRTGTVTAEQRGYLDAEFQALMEEITRIGEATEFNGVSLLDGLAGTVQIQVGIGTTANDTIDIDLRDSFTESGLGLSGINISDAPGTGATDALTALDVAMDRLNSGRANLGAKQNRLESSIRMNMNLRENLSAANSRIRDVDVARETSELAAAQILQQMAVAILSHAHRAPALILQLLA